MKQTIARWLRAIFTRKFLVRMAFVMAVIGTLLVVFYSVEKWRGRRAWEAYRADAERSGAMLSVKDFLRREKPKKDNYAAIPIFEEIFKAKDERREPQLGLPKWSAEDVKRPGFADPAEGSRLDLAKWREFFVTMKEIEVPGGDAARDLVEMIARRGPALQELRDASSRPDCLFPTRWEDGIATEMPHLGPLMRCAGLLNVNVCAQLGVGGEGVAKAAADVRHLLRLREAMQSEPCLISGMVRLTVFDQATGAIWQGLQSRQWREEDLAAFDAELARLNFFADYRFAIESERGLINDEFEQMAGNTSGRVAGEIAATAGLNSRGFALYPTGWLYQNMLRMNQYFDEGLKPFKMVGGVEPEAILEGTSFDKWAKVHLGGSSFSRVYYTFVNTLLPALDSMGSKFLKAHTRGVHARLGCALERYRRAKGEFPSKLDELVPQYMAAVPKDVCDGKAMRYRREADGGYTLWSVAMNRTDENADGGQPAVKDWVWRMPAQAAQK